MRYAVFAYCYREAVDWARENRVSRHDWFYVMDGTRLHGCRGNVTPVLASEHFWERRDSSHLAYSCRSYLGIEPKPLVLIGEQ